MKKIFTWCKLFIKRQLKRPSMIFVLIFMLLMSLALRVMSMDITAGAKVGFYINPSSTDYDSMLPLIESLESHTGIIEFVPYDSRQLMEEDVQAGTLQCAYVFSDDFYASLTEGNNRKLVELIEAPENLISLLSNVVILATVMENMSCDILVEDTISQNFFENITEEELDYLRESYDKYASNGSTFSFDYNSLYDQYRGSSQTINISDYLVTPVKGLVAIFVFIASLTGGISWFNDSNSFTFANIPLNRRPILKLLVIATPSVMAAAAGYVSLIIAGIYDNPLHELYVMTAYCILCIVFSYLLTAVVNEHIFSALIPVFILGSIICCPIFFNLASFIPAMKILQKLFMPSYFFLL